MGTAGWTLPKDVRDTFPAGASQLERYAQRFSCVEINSSFYRPHRPATYERWARSVPDDFRFALKVPKEITHARRLVAAAEPFAQFLAESSALGIKRDVLLVQLPPSFAFERVVVARFFRMLRKLYSGRIACEPRHATWFTEQAGDVLSDVDVARVAADPAVPGNEFAPGGSASFAYWRLHGSPRVYYSAYDDAYLAAMAVRFAASVAPVWCIFDNTTLGAATGNALSVTAALLGNRAASANDAS